MALRRSTVMLSTPAGVISEVSLSTQRCQLQAWRFSRRAIAWRLFFTCWIVYALHFATNTVREIYPALALGDHMTFDVSEYSGLHPDIFAVPGRGVSTVPIAKSKGAFMIAARMVATPPAARR